MSNDNPGLNTAPSLGWRILGGLLIVLGIALTASGACLLYLGGSSLDMVLGLVLTVAGILHWRGSIRGIVVYAALVAGAAVIALWDVGLDGWALLPRTGMWFGLLVIAGLCWTHRIALAGRLAIAVGIAGLAGLGVLIMDDRHVINAAPSAPRNTFAANLEPDDWPHYGRTLAATRFSPATQITPANVNQLDVAWIARTGDTAKPKGLRYEESTPLKVGRTLYFCTAYNEVIALDAATGKERWRFDPKVDRDKVILALCRGVSYHKSDSVTGECAARLIFATLDLRLMALDAETGQPCSGFGDQGAVNLNDNMGPVIPNFFFPVSPPAIVNGVAVIGHTVMDNQTTDSPSGVIRAYDAITGKPRWAWDIGRPGDTAPLPPDQLYTRNTPNSWTIFTADEALGLVYVPTGNAPPDYFGAKRRPEDEKYSTSTVALDAATGQVRWSFQAVHHDIWDYDIGTQPTLVDFPTENGPVPALIQGTKMGEIFVLDRRTGVPITRVEEKPAPTGAVPEDFTAPTQPYSVGMPNISGNDIAEKETWGLTPFDRLLCTIEFRNSTYQGRFTPPSLKPVLQMPGFSGGSGWGGVAVDTDRNIMVVNNIRVANRLRLVTREDVRKSGIKQLGEDGALFPAVVPYTQTGTPYGAISSSWRSPLGLPCHTPPWGVIAGIDLNTQKVIWSRPFGTTYDNGPLGIRSRLPLPAGVPNQGGAVTTASGLTFIAATLDTFMRAFDTRTGEELWRKRLPAGGQATPMTYTLDGRQYVVIVAGGHGILGTPLGDYVIAYALPAASP